MMKKLVYTEHLKLRLRLREIPEGYPHAIFDNHERRYYDVLDRTWIYIKKLEYNGKIRNMIIACREESETVDVITIHPMTDEKIINRVLKGRWVEGA